MLSVMNAERHTLANVGAHNKNTATTSADVHFAHLGLSRPDSPVVPSNVAKSWCPGSNFTWVGHWSLFAK